jgi:hypothetical protein
MGEKRNGNRVLVGKSEGKRPLGRPRHMREDYVRMDLRKIRRGGMDWINRSQDRGQWKIVVNTVMKPRVP